MSGLEIVRQRLGGDEIAVSQITPFRQAAARLRLAMLVHPPGDGPRLAWLPIGELAQPHSEWAALTYNQPMVCARW